MKTASQSIPKGVRDAAVNPIRPKWHWPAWATLVIIALIVCYRRPDQVLLPSFSYEAGTLFFVEDRAYGIEAFAIAPAGKMGGYLVTIPRLVAFLGGFVDLPLVPTFYNICAGMFLLCVAAMCIYSRIETPYRHFLALALVLVPHGGEVFLDTNLLSFLCAPVLVVLILQKDATTWKQWLVDFLALFLAGLSGPFLAIFLIPLLVVRFFRGGATRYNVTLSAIAVLLAGIQISLMVHNGRLAADFHQATRPTGGPPEGFTPEVLLQVISVSFAGPFLLGNVLPIVAQPLAWVVTAVFLASLAAIAWRAGPTTRINVRVLLGLAVLMCLVQLYRSRTFPTFDHPFYAGQRYFYLPYLFLCWTLIVACADDRKWIRISAMSCLGLMLLSSATQFSRPLSPDTRWKEFARLVEQGYDVVIPINPTGWSIRVGPHDRGRQLEPDHVMGYHPERKLGPILDQTVGSPPRNSLGGQ